jgi:hypothetical protein
MRFEVDQRLHAPLPAVESALLDPAFIDELKKLPKLGKLELLEQTTNGTAIHRRVRYTFGGEVSAAVRAVVDPDRLTWVEDSMIDRRTHVTTFTIEPDYYARLLEASGTIRLSPLPSDTATRREVDGNVTVHVPLVGRKVEQVIVNDLKDYLGKEGELVERWVASHQ